MIGDGVALLGVLASHQRIARIGTHSYFYSACISGLMLERVYNAYLYVYMRAYIRI